MAISAFWFAILRFSVRLSVFSYVISYLFWSEIFGYQEQKAIWTSLNLKRKGKKKKKRKGRGCLFCKSTEQFYKQITALPYGKLNITHSLLPKATSFTAHLLGIRRGLFFSPLIGSTFFFTEGPPLRGESALFAFIFKENILKCNSVILSQSLLSQAWTFTNWPFVSF